MHVKRSLKFPTSRKGGKGKLSHTKILLWNLQRLNIHGGIHAYSCWWEGESVNLQETKWQKAQMGALWLRNSTSKKTGKWDRNKDRNTAKVLEILQMTAKDINTPNICTCNKFLWLQAT